MSDSLFAMAAADGGLAEVTLAELGVQKATDPELKKFSQHMIEEHTKMNAELTALAARKGMALPRTITIGHQFCAQSLAGLSGEEFDRCYAKAQLVLHMDSVAKFEAEAERGQDPDVKALAAKSLPHIKEHLKEIKPIAMRYEKEKPSTAGAPLRRPLIGPRIRRDEKAAAGPRPGPAAAFVVPRRDVTSGVGRAARRLVLGGGVLLLGLVLRRPAAAGASLANFRAAEFMQKRRPVGAGPSSKTWPRWAPQVLQTTSVRA